MIHAGLYCTWFRIVNTLAYYHACAVSSIQYPGTCGISRVRSQQYTIPWYMWYITRAQSAVNNTLVYHVCAVSSIFLCARVLTNPCFGCNISGLRHGGLFGTERPGLLTLPAMLTGQRKRPWNREAETHGSN